MEKSDILQRDAQKSLKEEDTVVETSEELIQEMKEMMGNALSVGVPDIK